MTDHVPDGFARHFRQSPLTDPWEPLWSRQDDEGFALGVRIGRAHCNSRGFAHGGLISALADNAMGLACAPRLSEGNRLVTVSLAVDFLGSAQIGQWLQVDAAPTRVGWTLTFAEATITADGEVCGRAHATFRLLRRAA
jgi:uncharacterized protein (TIGR00369 family)